VLPEQHLSGEHSLDLYLLPIRHPVRSGLRMRPKRRGQRCVRGDRAILRACRQSLHQQCVLRGGRGLRRCERVLQPTRTSASGWDQDLYGSLPGSFGLAHDSGASPSVTASVDTVPSAEPCQRRHPWGSPGPRSRRPDHRAGVEMECPRRVASASPPA
jgi:hypothetical protein